MNIGRGGFAVFGKIGENSTTEAEMMVPSDPNWSSCVAIIGMSGRFPGAPDLEQFWNNLKNGVESISFFSASEMEKSDVNPLISQSPDFVNAAGVLNDIELFDAAFFGFNAREAETLDPQQRLLLECAWHAMEDAGYDPEKCSGPVGIFAGSALSTYLFNLLSQPEFRNLVGDFQVFTGNDKDFLTTRISYKLNLKGPSVAVQSACSTSLVAVALACDSLLNRQCDMALAGGVAIRVPQNTGYVYQEGQIFSRDGHTRSFDASASGTVFTNGVGLVVLKRLPDAIEDGDCIRAIVRGWAVNNDGSLKVGYAAPSLDAQAEVVATALALADVPPSSVTYVEAHGTATPMGDPIEIAALTKAFRARTDRKNFCAIGSVKSNIGHADTASGIAALLKTVLALEHAAIPATINFDVPNPRIDFKNGPFFVNAKLSEWNAPSPRRAAVHSFGIGGTNGHVILEEAPPKECPPPGRPRQLLLWSARSKTARQAASRNLAAYLKNNPQVSLADAAYTSHVGRREFAQRGMLVCADTADAAPALDRLDGQRVLTGTKFVNERSVAFMFPGQGSGYTSMGAELYRNESRFREIVDECSEILCSMVGYSLRDVLYSSHATNGAIDLQGTENCELALFVMEYALAHLWMEWGVRPDCMIGQSIGEYVAACLAGVLSLPDSLFLLSTRSKLMYKASAGAMLAVLLPEREVAGLLGSELDLAAVNGASECVIAGPEVTIGELEAAINQRGQQCMRVPVRHALHSRMMDSISKELSAATLQLKLRPPQIPYISNVTGTWITPALATDHAYWGRQLRSTVRFADGISSLVKVADRILLEVGPGQTIRRLVLGHALRPPDQAVFGSMPSLNGETETEAMLNSLGKLWLQGKKIDWQGFWKHEKRSRVPLPTYAFDRKRYWIERQVGDAETPTVPAPAAGNTPCAAPQEKRESLVDDHASAYEAPTDDVEQRIAEIWQKLLGVERVGVYDSFFALGGHSMQGAQLLSMLRATFQVAIPLPTLFEVPTVAGMAERIRTLRPGTG